MENGSTHSQKESKVRVVLVLVDKVSDVSRLSHGGRGNRVQVGDDGFGVGIDVRASGQSGESGFWVEFEEGWLEVLAVQKVYDLKLDIDAELRTGGERRYQKTFRGQYYLLILTRRLQRQQPRQSGGKCRELAVEQRISDNEPWNRAGRVPTLDIAGLLREKRK